MTMGEATAATRPFPTAGALPEVLGDAALLVDPYDEDALAEALEADLAGAFFPSACSGAGSADGATLPIWQQRLSIYVAVGEMVIGVLVLRRP